MKKVATLVGFVGLVLGTFVFVGGASALSQNEIAWIEKFRSFNDAFSREYERKNRVKPEPAAEPVPTKLPGQQDVHRGPAESDDGLKDELEKEKAERLALEALLAQLADYIEENKEDGSSPVL